MSREEENSKAANFVKEAGFYFETLSLPIVRKQKNAKNYRATF